MKRRFDKLKNWWRYDRREFWEWVIDMDIDHSWFRPLVIILSSLVGWAIGLSIFCLILSMLHR